MIDASRRNFLTLAGAGVAAAGVAAVAPKAIAAAGSGGSTTTPTLSLPKGAAGSIAAFVHDVEKGEVAVMVEGREVLITDHQLVARLAHALATAGF